MMKKRRIGHAGTSIVEILIAMVILVIGIFGIIRIFPTGFGLILYGEQVTKAEKMANAVLEAARARSDNLPDAVVPVRPDGVLDAALTPGTEAEDMLNPLPSNPDASRFFGFNRARRVLGETTKIPPPTADVPYMPIDPRTGQPQLVSLYALQFGPVDTLSELPVDMLNGGRFLVYSGSPMERRVLTQEPSEDDARELGFFRYGVSYQGNRMVLFFAPAPYPRVFKLQFSYTVSTGQNGFLRAQSLPSAAVPLPAGAFRTEVTAPGSGVIEQGEEIVARGFTAIPLAAPFDVRDPYQYKVLNEFVGILGFNPLGAAARVEGSSRALTAKIDYDVADWHIVSEDVIVPQEAPHRVRLTLNFLKRANDIQGDQTVYTGLLPVAGFNGIDMIVVDLDRGVTLDSRTLLPEEANDNGAVDYRGGVLTFAPAVRWTLPTTGELGPAESIAGQHLRVYYRTENDFGLQVQKAFTNYLRSELPTTVTPGQYGQLPYGYLVFPASDNNQTVLVDYSFEDASTNRRTRVSGELQPIRDPQTELDSPARIFSGFPAHQWFIRVNNRDLSPQDSALSSNQTQVVPGSIVIHSVRGVSIRSRTAWREGPRWRRLENSTYLSRQGT